MTYSKAGELPLPLLIIPSNEIWFIDLTLFVNCVTMQLVLPARDHA